MGNNKRPVLIQINTGITGSTGRIAQQIGELAISNGWDSWIAYSGREKEVESSSHLIRVGGLFDTLMHVVSTRLFDCHGFQSKKATKCLLQKIDEIKPDIVHLHNLHGYYLNIPILFDYLAKANINIIWTLHDCWAFTGHCVHFTDVNCYKWKEEAQEHCCNCPKKRGYPTSYFLDRSKENYTLKKKIFTSIDKLTVVPVSYWLGSVTSESFLGQYPIHVIQNGIDINMFFPRRERVKEVREKYGWKNKFVILGVAKGWSEDVGMSTFFKLRERLDDSYSIAMVGLTEKQKSQLPNGITGILRTQNADELAEIYTASDVFFNGSYQETFGLVTAEAMACGTPAIVYNSTACPEIVDKDRGRIIPVNDFEKLLEAITALKELSLSEQEKISVSCEEYVKTHLDKNKKYKEYIQLYNKILPND